VVEFDRPLQDREQCELFAQVLDDALCQANDDYRAHRSRGYGLRPPRIIVVCRGTFAGWMKQRGQLGGQHKVPRVINDQELFQNLLGFAAAHPAGVETQSA
jgi:hypothetical protein